MTRSNPTSPEDLAFLQQVSDQIALALESARLSAQTQSALAQSEKLVRSQPQSDAGLRLAGTGKTAVETFNIPVINGAELDTFNYDSEGELESLDIVANWWNGSGTEARGDRDRIIQKRCSRHKVVPELHTGLLQRYFTQMNAWMRVCMRIVKTFNIRAVTVLPLFVGTHQIGVLVLEAEEPHNFTEDETRLFSAWHRRSPPCWKTAASSNAHNNRLNAKAR